MLRNVYGESNTSIVFINGEPVSTSTGWTELPPSTGSYPSGDIYVSVSKPDQTNSTIDLVMETCYSPTGGACVYYPITIIIDPIKRTTIINNIIYPSKPPFNPYPPFILVIPPPTPPIKTNTTVRN